MILTVLLISKKIVIYLENPSPAGASSLRDGCSPSIKVYSVITKALQGRNLVPIKTIL
jgi:hypothetical protein